jgi:hypothetical protein
MSYGEKQVDRRGKRVNLEREVDASTGNRMVLGREVDAGRDNPW